MGMKKLILLLIAIAFTVAACKKQKQASAIFTYKKVDGCTWLIQLPDGNLLEATNLNEFNVVPYEGKKIDITYVPAKGASVCMMGEIVKLKSLKEK
jgi:hypothetical protein